MSDKRMAIAIEAAAEVVHDQMKDKPDFSWERSSEAWRNNLREVVRPVVKAAIEAADGYDKDHR